MIILLEPICSSWTHEEVNAGFLQLVRKNSSDEVVYIGEKEHVRCIRNILADSNVDYKVIAGQMPWQDTDSYENTASYFRLLCSIILKYKPSILFVLCGYRPCILAVEMVSFLFPHIKINLTIHGMVEEYKGNGKSYKNLFKLAECFRNLQFVTYSPFCTESYWGLKRKKFFFLHHPYINIENKIFERQGCKKEKITIGIIGACANDKALRVIYMVNKCELNQNYEFLVISRFGRYFRHLKNVRVMELEFDRESKNRLMKDMDYLLLPYGRYEYALSASGVLWDAIANQVPCLMLDSKYFEYYMPHTIGYQAKDINELCKVICKIIQLNREKSEIFFTDIGKIEQERDRIMRQMLL